MVDSAGLDATEAKIIVEDSDRYHGEVFEGDAAARSSLGVTSIPHCLIDIPSGDPIVFSGGTQVAMLISICKIQK